MKKQSYLKLKQKLIDSGYQEEIDWQTNLILVTEPIVFRNEAIWVILNSGMKEQVARLIQTRIFQAIADQKDISTAFKHEGKVKAIKYILKNYKTLFKEFYLSKDRLTYLQTIPYIGVITKYHLAKNLGLDTVKPDRHLERIALFYGFTPFTLCEHISNQTGDKVSVVDIVLWRAANLRLV